MRNTVISLTLIATIVFAVPADAVELEQCEGGVDKRVDCVARNTIKINATLEKTTAELRAEVARLKEQLKLLTSPNSPLVSRDQLSKSLEHVRLKSHNGEKACLTVVPNRQVALAECSSGVGGSVDWTLQRFGQ